MQSRRQQWRKSWVAFPLFLGIWGCAAGKSEIRTDSAGSVPKQAAEVPLVQLSDAEFQTVGDRIVYLDGKTGKRVSEQALWQRLSESDFVLVGESHDQASHHRLQVRIIRKMQELKSETWEKTGVSQVIVGMEMVSWDRQQALDVYQKEEVDEQGLQAALEWETSWGYDFGLYEDVFKQALKGGSKLIGINAPRSLVRAVAKQGIEDLNAEQKSQLPEMDLSNVNHKEIIRDVFEHHHPSTASGNAFDRFYTAQVLWDETMAEKSVDAYVSAAAENAVVVVLAGNGHVAGYDGIPNRIKRRLPTSKMITIVPLLLETGDDPSAVATEAVQSRIADVVMLELPPIRLEM